MGMQPKLFKISEKKYEDPTIDIEEPLSFSLEVETPREVDGTYGGPPYAVKAVIRRRAKVYPNPQLFSHATNVEGDYQPIAAVVELIGKDRKTCYSIKFPCCFISRYELLNKTAHGEEPVIEEIEIRAGHVQFSNMLSADAEAQEIPDAEAGNIEYKRVEFGGVSKK